MYGIKYPELFDLSIVRGTNYGQGNGFPLAYYLLEDKRVTSCAYDPVSLDCLSRHLTDARPDQDVLLSTEWFTALSEQALTRLNQAADSCGYDVIIFGYVRSYMSYLNSEFAQLVKIGELTEDADDWDANWNIPNQIDMFTRVFGEKALLLRPFEASEWIGESIYHDAAISMGFPKEKLEQLSFPDLSNKAIIPELINIQLNLNRRDLTLTQEELNLMSRFSPSQTSASDQVMWFSPKRSSVLQERYFQKAKSISREFFDKENLLEKVRKFVPERQLSRLGDVHFSLPVIQKIAEQTYDEIRNKSNLERAKRYAYKINHYLIFRSQGYI